MSRIAAVAIRFQGEVYSLPKPYRHHHVIRMIVEMTGVEHINARAEDQGFLDEEGRYLTREEALKVALENGQVLDPNNVRCGMLFSEDLW